jgi:hypothetical protein
MKMSIARTTRLFRTALAAVLAAAVVILAPGLAPYEAAAQVVSVGAVGAASHGPAVNVAPISFNGGVSAIPSATAFAPALGGSFSNLSAPSASIGLTGAPSALAVSPAAALTPGRAAAAFPVLPASALTASPAASIVASPLRAAPAVAAAPVVGAEGAASALRSIPAANDGVDGKDIPGVRGELSRATAALDAAGDAKTGVLDGLYSGMRRYFGLDESSASNAKPSAPSASVAPVPVSAPLVSAAPALAAPTPAGFVERRATPPSPIAFVGPGLRAGDKFLAAADGPAAPAVTPTKPVEGPQNDDWIDKKAMTGMFIQRSISIALFIQTALAYPLIAIHAVGTTTFGVLMALGPLAAIATGPINGLIADKMSPRNGLILLNVTRALQTLALPVLAYFGMLSFPVLLAMSIANGWQLALLMTSENAYLRRLAGKNHLGNLNALNAVNYLALQVFLTLILGVGAWIDKLGLMTPYWASSIILPFVVIPIIWFTIPKSIPGEAVVGAKGPKKSAGEIVKGLADSAKTFVTKYWKEIGILAASLGVYLGFHTTLPMSLSLFYWVSRTDGFKAVWAQKSLRATMLLSALAFGLIYPFQYMAMPLMAGVLGGAAGKAAILSQLLGALFFGQLAANASQANLPSVKIPFTNKTVKAERLVQAMVLAMGVAWSFLRLFPGNWLAAAGAAAVGATMMFGASKFTDRGWVKYLGLGLAAASVLPMLFWGSLPVIFSGMLALGLFVGPVQVALNTYFGKNARSASIGNAFGVSSSLNNAATSLGYGLLTTLIGLFNPMFPHALGPIAIAFGIVGAIFFFLGPKLLPGLAEKSFASSSKPAAPAAPADKK